MSRLLPYHFYSLFHTAFLSLTYLSYLLYLPKRSGGEVIIEKETIHFWVLVSPLFSTKKRKYAIDDIKCAIYSQSFYLSVNLIKPQI